MTSFTVPWGNSDSIIRRGTQAKFGCIWPTNNHELSPDCIRIFRAIE